MYCARSPVKSAVLALLSALSGVVSPLDLKQERKDILTWTPPTATTTSPDILDSTHTTQTKALHLDATMQVNLVSVVSGFLFHSIVLLLVCEIINLLVTLGQYFKISLSWKNHLKSKAVYYSSIILMWDSVYHLNQYILVLIGICFPLDFGLLLCTYLLYIVLHLNWHPAAH